MRPLSLLAIITFAASFVGCERTTTLRGSVFIVTRGGDNVKLGLVQVSAIPSAAMMEHLHKKDAEFKKGGWRTPEGVEEGGAKSQDLARHIFESLPSTTAQALTDADGRFAIPVPKGKEFYLAAKATREIGSTKEDYHWLVYAKASDSPQEVILSNQNLLVDYRALTLFASAAFLLEKAK